MNKVERFKKAFEYLRKKGIIESKTQLASKIGYSRIAVSNAYSGNEDYLTEKFLVKFNNAFPGIFNLDWLMDGEGDMLQASHLPQEPIKDVQPTSAPTEMEKWLMRQNEELVALLKEAQATIKEKDQQIINLSQNVIQANNFYASAAVADGKITPYADKKNF